MIDSIKMTVEELEKTNDSELIMLYRENDEDAKNILYYKYKFIINILLNKYAKVIAFMRCDYEEVYSECSLGFSDGLKSYQEGKDSSLPTFLTICIERRLKGVLRKYRTDKYRLMKETISLDFLYDNNSLNLLDITRDEEHEPLKNITDEEEYQELLDKIESKLTKNEFDVFSLIIRGLNYQEIAKILNKTPKQVDNSIQRVKAKIRLIILNKSND